MSYNQAVGFNQSKGGNRKNFCLWNVCQGYQIGNKYPSAWEAWEHTKQHTDTPPPNLDVPVFFSYIAHIDGETKNWGHIGVRLSDGRFWSDGTVYNSIEAYTLRYAPKYVGWGESINDIRILNSGNQEDDMKISNNNEATYLTRLGTHAMPKDDSFTKNLVGKDLTTAIQAIESLGERRSASYKVENFDRVMQELEALKKNPSDAETLKRLEQIRVKALEIEELTKG